MKNETLPRKSGESLTDWTLRFMVDALNPNNSKELDKRVEAARQRDANHLCIEEEQ